MALFFYLELCGTLASMSKYSYEHSKAYYDSRKRELDEYQTAYREDHRQQAREYMVAYRKEHPDKIRKYRKANREKINAAKRDYYEKHDGAAHMREYRHTHEDTCSAIGERYRKNHPEVKRAAGARRRAAKLNATPPWLNHKMELEIRRVYAMASRMSRRDGIEYHVDHIVPLQGASASGLHVPWNLQIIPALDNIAKKNKVPTLEEVQTCATRMKAIMERHGR